MKLPKNRKTLLSGLIGATLIAAPVWAPVWAKAPPAPMMPAQGPQSDFPVVVGAPYQVGGVSFVPSDSMNFDSVGYATIGSGDGISAAHHTLPVPSYAEVTDIKTGRTILVRVDRRGPMDNTHAIELSPAAASQLGLAGGEAAVRVRRVNPPEAERALLRSGNPAPERMPTPKPLLDVLQRKLNPGMAQRSLDNGDDDAAAPAPKVAAPKIAAAQPVVAKPVAAKSAPAKVLPPAPKPIDPASMPTSSAPPKGYVPSVPAPVMKTSVGKKPVGAAPKPPGEGAFHEAFEAKQAEKPAKAETAKKPAAKPVETAVKPADAPAKEAAKPAGSMTVQAGAFSDKARAQAVADKIGGSISKAGAVWRVRVGPYTSHGSAEAALAKVKSAGYSDARIQRAE